MSCSACAPSAPWWAGSYAGAHLPGCSILGDLRGISEAEHHMLQHVSRWGSDGYGAYYAKVKGGWIRTGPGAPPTVYRRKGDMVAGLESFLDVLRAALAGRL